MNSKKHQIISSVAILVLVLLAVIAAAINSGKNKPANTATSQNATDGNVQGDKEVITGTGNDESAGGEIGNTDETENDGVQGDSEKTEDDDIQGGSEKNDSVDDFSVSINKDNTWGENPVYTQLAIVLYISTAATYEALAFATCFATEDQKDAMKAFMEKRKLEKFKNH